MGSSSSKPRYAHGELSMLRGHSRQREDTSRSATRSAPYLPYQPPRSASSSISYPPQTNPGPYMPQRGVEPQFGYFIRQRGANPNDVEMVPGYYYPASISEASSRPRTRERRRRPHRRNQSAPSISSSGLLDQDEPQHPTEPRATSPPIVNPPQAPASNTSDQPPVPRAQTPEAAEAPTGTPAPPPEQEPRSADLNASSSARQPADPVPNPEDLPVQPSAERAERQGGQDQRMPEIGTGDAGMPTISKRTRNPMPAPPIDVLQTEKFKSLRRSKTDSTRVSNGNESGSGAFTARSNDTTAPASSTVGKRNEKRHSKRDDPLEGSSKLPSPPPPSDRKRSSSSHPRRPKSSGETVREENSVSTRPRSPPQHMPGKQTTPSNNIFRSLLRPRKLKKALIPTAHHPPEADYTGYPHPMPSTKYTSSIPLPKYTPSPQDFPVDTGPPYIFYLNSNLNPSAPYPVAYKSKVYPTGAHLFEAFKFLKHKPELAERIRVCSMDAYEMSMLSWQFQMSGSVREDWEHVWQQKLDEMLYLRFTQHERLRAELMATGYAQLVDGNEPRDDHVVDAPGVNELGKGLMRLRERLRRAGEREMRR